jgi:hypothetical protein
MIETPAFQEFLPSGFLVFSGQTFTLLPFSAIVMLYTPPKAGKRHKNERG